MWRNILNPFSGSIALSVLQVYNVCAGGDALAVDNPMEAPHAIAADTTAAAEVAIDDVDGEATPPLPGAASSGGATSSGSTIEAAAGETIPIVDAPAATSDGADEDIAHMDVDADTAEIAELWKACSEK